MLRHLRVPLLHGLGMLRHLRILLRHLRGHLRVLLWLRLHVLWCGWGLRLNNERRTQACRLRVCKLVHRASVRVCVTHMRQAPCEDK
jgi:hypothetical protein